MASRPAAGAPAFSRRREANPSLVETLSPVLLFVALLFVASAAAHHVKMLVVGETSAPASPLER